MCFSLLILDHDKKPKKLLRWTLDHPWKMVVLKALKTIKTPEMQIEKKLPLKIMIFDPPFERQLLAGPLVCGLS